MTKKIYSLLIPAAAVFALFFTSCGSSNKALIVPYAVSTVETVPVEALNLQKGDYAILSTVTETASVRAVYKKDQLRIIGGDGDFTYTFNYKKDTGWELHSFSGAATLGFLVSDAQTPQGLPQAEEFARKVATAKVIEHVKDYGADGVIEPVVTMRASNVSKNEVEYQATVTAKLFKINE